MMYFWFALYVNLYSTSTPVHNVIDKYHRPLRSLYVHRANYKESIDKEKTCWPGMNSAVISISNQSNLFLVEIHYFFSNVIAIWCHALRPTVFNWLGVVSLELIDLGSFLLTHSSTVFTTSLVLGRSR